MDPEANTHFEMAVGLHRAGRDVEAETELRWALDVDPDFGLAWALLGSVLDDSGKSDAAQSALREAIRCEPGCARNYSLLADLLIDAGNYGEAEALARQSIELDPLAHRWCILGVALSKQGKYEAAASAHEAALDANPGFDEAMVNLASLLVDSDPVRAKVLLEAALKIDPDWDEARDLLSNLR